MHVYAHYSGFARTMGAYMPTACALAHAMPHCGIQHRGSSLAHVHIHTLLMHIFGHPDVICSADACWHGPCLGPSGPGTGLGPFGALGPKDPSSPKEKMSPSFCLPFSSGESGAKLRAKPGAERSSGGGVVGSNLPSPSPEGRGGKVSSEARLMYSTYVLRTYVPIRPSPEGGWADVYVRATHVHTLASTPL